MSALAEGTGAKKKSRVSWEVADIFRHFGDTYRSSHSLPVTHLKVMHQIEVCRTAYLGGHLERCADCGFERQAYNSCRNRHCPKCQALSKARWLEARKAEVLPVEYFHSVFTLPHELNPLVLTNKKVLLDCLFQAVSETLLSFGETPKYLGGKLGFIAILHTWDQTLNAHFHLHCLIPAGGLSPDGQHWLALRQNFLFPVRALSKVFRGKFIALLKEAFDSKKLIFPGQSACLGIQESFSKLLTQLWQKEWVVYAKASFPGAEQVLDYLGRYTHRVAISNHRIQNIENGTVSFTYKDRKDLNKRKQMTLEPTEFIRRFLLHVLPDGYVRIRYFGFLANRCKKDNLQKCHQLLHLLPHQPNLPKSSFVELLLTLTGHDILLCPGCKQGKMRVIGQIPKMESLWDTS